MKNIKIIFILGLSLKDRFGDKFSFWGSIDRQDLLPNESDEDLERDIIKKIKILVKDDAYMISPAHLVYHFFNLYNFNIINL